MDPLHEENSDRSYKFSHVSEPVDGSILRQEESDADGNIKGISNYLRNHVYNTRKYPLRGYILGVLTHTTAWEQLWEGDVF